MTRTPARRTAAQDVAYEWIKEHVSSLPREEGTFITEAGIVETIKLSRTPVREALLRLEAEGFLQILPKKGIYIPAVSDAEVDNVMEARALVEAWCIRRLHDVRLDVADALDRILDQQKRLVGKPVEFITCDRVFHRTIVTAAQNFLLRDFYESLRDRQLRMGLRALASSKSRSRQIIAEHTLIADGLRTGDLEIAVNALSDHLDSTLAAIRNPRLGSRSQARAIGGDPA